MPICGNRSKNRKESVFDWFVQRDAFCTKGKSSGSGGTESSGGHFSPRKLSHRNPGQQCRWGGLAHPDSDVSNGMSLAARWILQSSTPRREKTSCWRRTCLRNDVLA